MDRPILSEFEWDLVIELLQQEKIGLLAEIHHCDNSSYREYLIRRQRKVSELLDRVVPAEVANVSGCA